MDYTIFSFINSFAGKWICLDSFAIFFAQYFVYWLVAGAVVAFFLIKSKKEKIRYLILATASVILSRLVITELIRVIWYRPRPFVVHTVNSLIEHSASASFPSGHIAFLFALATVIYFVNKRFGIIFFIFCFFVGLARIFVGIHYPLDIAGGIFVGVISAIGVKVLINKKLKISK